MTISIYNSQTRRKEEFRPINSGKIGIYVCGVTVYDDIHLGHARSAVTFDAIIRYFRYKGFEVNHVTNFTDVDDKIIARAKDLGIGPLELSEKFIEKYFEEISKLHVARASHYPKASETIPEMIQMIETLIKKGYAYAVDGDVYFDIEKTKDYGKLSGQSLEKMQAGARIEVDEKKRNPADFALWKAAKKDEISWSSPWGEGRPGWHIECSAMALKYIGETIDIHGGGNELIFPHHENEVQQSEAANGKPFANYWMHNGLLMINEEKMSKSLDNFFTVGEILKKYEPSVVRCFLLNAHYRQPLSFDESSMETTKKNLERLRNTYSKLREAKGKSQGTEDCEELSKKALSDFEEKMNDDFNTREALAVIFSLARDANRILENREISDTGIDNILSVFDTFDTIFDILKTEGDERTSLDLKLLDLILAIREKAREDKDFATADAIRDGLMEMGIEIQDSADGPKWKLRQ